MNNPLMRFPTFQQTSASTAVDQAGSCFDFFGGCNYLGLAQHPRVAEAVARFVASHGLSAGASRTTTGNSSLHDQLEARLAKFLDCPAVCLLPDGYTANIAAAQALAALGLSTAYIDERAHPSLRDAAAAAGVRTIRFPHRSTPTMEGDPPSCIWTDGVFTADGSLAPVKQHLTSLSRSGTLLVDDCHGFAALGPGGRGSTTGLLMNEPRLVLTSTLAKGLGAAGGFVAGSEEVIDQVRRTSAFVCTTPIAPALAAGSLAALSVLVDEPERVSKVEANVRLARESLREAGLVLRDQPAPIIGFAPFDAQRLRAMRDSLLADGVIAPLIEYPGGHRPLYFRLILTSEHTQDQIERLAKAMRHAIDSTVDVAV